MDDKIILNFFEERTGYTYNPQEAIYVLRDGRLVSGGYDCGIRGEDHMIAEGLIDLDRYDNEFWSKLHYETDFIRLVPETKTALIMEGQKINSLQESVIMSLGVKIEEYCPSYDFEKEEVEIMSETKSREELQALEFLDKCDLNGDDLFRYQMLGRLKFDCEGYLYSFSPNCLWAKDEQKQVNIMKNLYLSFPDDKKPKWISMDDIKNYESKMVKSRAEELAEKIGLKENAYCLEKMPDWIEQSKPYSENMIKDNLVNSNNVKEVRLIYLLNKLCPNLHHFKQKPFGTESNETYNKMMREYTMENSQAEFLAKDGSVIQKGVVISEKEFDKFISVMKKYIEKLEPEIKVSNKQFINEDTPKDVLSELTKDEEEMGRFAVAGDKEKAIQKLEKEHSKTRNEEIIWGKDLEGAEDFAKDLAVAQETSLDIDGADIPNNTPQERLRGLKEAKKRAIQKLDEKKTSHSEVAHDTPKKDVER